MKIQFYRNRTAMLVPVSSELPSTLEGACHSYIDELMPRDMRRDTLKVGDYRRFNTPWKKPQNFQKKYKFLCQCDGCLDEDRNARMEAWTCGICVKGWMRNKENGQCELCGWTMSKDHFELCRTAEEAGIAARSRLANDAIPLETKRNLCEKLLDLFQDTLHDHNVHRIPVLRCLYICSLAAQK